jgi:membrane-associated protease RseP (regulator of RpoE activity)
MPEEKGLGSKLLGLFVEKADATPDEGTPAVSKPDSEKSAAELVAELANETAPKKGAHPAPAAPPAMTSRPPPPARPVLPQPSGPVTAATVDFDAVFKTAGLDTAELDRVRKAEDLLKSLPEATPQEVKRQIVEASLKAFGFDVQKIIAAAQNQLKALDTYVRVNETQTAKAITDAQAQIAQLEDKVISLRADITKKTDSLASTSAAADVRKSQVHGVLDFFGAPATASKS